MIGVLLSATAVMTGWWWLAIPLMIATICLILFFRDPDRPIPTQRGIMVSPADGKVSSVHEVEFFEPFNGPATCVRIFLSVFDVHINRSPIHGVVTSITHKPGQHLNVLNPESAEVNESNLIILAHPVRRDTIAAMRQVAGLCARTICCTVSTGSVIQRGQRFGIIKLGSTTELYIPQRFNPQVLVEQGQYVYGGSTILANVNLGPAREGEEDEDGTQDTHQTSAIDTATQTDDPNAKETLIATAVATEIDTTDDQVTLAEETQPQPDEDDTQATDELDAITAQEEEEEEYDESLEDGANEESQEIDEDEVEEDQEAEIDEEDQDDSENEEDDTKEDYVEEPDAEELDEDLASEDTDEVEQEDVSDEQEDAPDDVVTEESDEEPQAETSAQPKSRKKKTDEDQSPMLF